MAASVSMSDTTATLCMAAEDSSCDFKCMQLERRAVGDLDVLIDMKFCGVCHTDLHATANHMAPLLPTAYPIVPGHELVGLVAQVGPKVTKVKVGDVVGVGCMVDSCMKCKSCKKGEEQLCMKQSGTYNGNDGNTGRCGTIQTPSVNGKKGHKKTLGGYTSKMVVTEHFAIKIPTTYPIEAAGPVMCAGVTMYDPLKKQGVTKGSRVGIIGLGGLGQMGIKIAKAMGAHVTAISRNDKKKAFATECGADNYIASETAEDMKTNAGTLDVILNTIPTYHDYLFYNSLLSKNGKQCLLGLHAGLVGAMLSGGGKKVIGSGIGGIRSTQEVIDLCAEHNIQPDITVVSVSELNKVYEDLENNLTGKRYVLDLATLQDGIKQSQKAPALAPKSSGFSVCTVLKELCAFMCCCR